MKIPHIHIHMPTLTVNHARVIAGAGSFGLTVLVFGMMWAKPELASNDLFKSLSQAIVIQGLIGLVMAFLFTGNSRQPDPPSPPDAKTAARQTAEAAVNMADDIGAKP